MKIETLVDDIYGVIGSGKEVPEEATNAFTRDLAGIIKQRVQDARGKAGYLRVSNLGEHCDRKLWLSVNHPDTAEPLPPNALLKFLLGDVWEAVLLFLARVSGHDVKGEQDEVSLFGVTGHRDAVIDGTVVDVKSASTRSFSKFEDGLSHETDSFGYIFQLQSYLECGQDDPVVTDKDRAAFLVGDKTLGDLHLDMHSRHKIDFEALVQKKKEMLASPKLPPRGYPDVEDGKSGNRKLGVACSYCPFKKVCWTNLRGFAYSNGPRFLTNVNRLPDVPEFPV